MTSEQEKNEEKSVEEACKTLISDTLTVAVKLVDSMIDSVPQLPDILSEMNSVVQDEMITKAKMLPVSGDHPIDQERVHMKANVFWGFSELIRFRIRQREVEDRIKLSEEAQKL